MLAYYINMGYPMWQIRVRRVRGPGVVVILVAGGGRRFGASAGMPTLSGDETLAKMGMPIFCCGLDMGDENLFGREFVFEGLGYVVDGRVLA